jgi:hypothetical protein
MAYKIERLEDDKFVVHTLETATTEDGTVVTVLGRCDKVSISGVHSDISALVGELAEVQAELDEKNLLLQALLAVE